MSCAPLVKDVHLMLTALSSVSYPIYSEAHVNSSQSSCMKHIGFFEQCGGKYVVDGISKSWR